MIVHGKHQPLQWNIGKVHSIDRVVPHAPDENVAERIQIGAAVVIHDAFRITGRARRVVESNRFPLIFGRHFREGGLASCEKCLVIHLPEKVAARSHRVGDIDHQRLSLKLIQCLFDDRGKFGVGNQYFGFTMLEDKRDRRGIEADIERIQHRSGHRYAEMRLKRLRDVGRHHRNGVAASDPARPQGCREPAAAFEGFAPAVAPLSIGDGEPVRIHRSAA